MGNCYMYDNRSQSNPSDQNELKNLKKKQISYMEKVNQEKIRSSKPDPTIAVRIDDIPPNYRIKDPELKGVIERSEDYEKFFVDASEYENLLFFRPYKFIKSGAIYIGQWKKAKRHGYGELYWPDGFYYMGCWSQDKVDIRGELFYDGNFYQGGFKDGKFEGKGALIWKNGAKFDGSFWQNKKCHDGTEVLSDGTSVHQTFVGLGNRQLVVNWADGSSYDGTVILGNNFEKGLYRWPDGRRFDGTWKNGTADNGWFYWPDGRKYKGPLKDGLMDGTGDFYWPDGTKYSGKYSKGKKSGEGIVFLGNGMSFRTTWWSNRLAEHRLIVNSFPQNGKNQNPPRRENLAPHPIIGDQVEENLNDLDDPSARPEDYANTINQEETKLEIQDKKLNDHRGYQNIDVYTEENKGIDTGNIPNEEKHRSQILLNAYENKSGQKAILPNKDANEIENDEKVSKQETNVLNRDHEEKDARTTSQQHLPNQEEEKEQQQENFFDHEIEEIDYETGLEEKKIYLGEKVLENKQEDHKTDKKELQAIKIHNEVASDVQASYYEIIMGFDEKVDQNDVRVNKISELNEIFTIPDMN